MKIAFSTLGSPKWSFERIVKEAKSNGYKGIELRGIQEEIYLPKVRALQKENQKVSLQLLKTNNIVITDLGTGLSFHDSNKFDKSMSEGKDYINLASQLGVPYIRVFGDKIPDQSKKSETFAQITKGINALCGYGLDKKVTCLLETHGDLASIETLQPIIDGISHENFGIIWDIGHTYKVYGDDIGIFLDKMWSYIKHVHIKDLKLTQNDLELCMVGEGIIPIPAIIDELKKRGFQGYLSLEWEKRWHEDLEDAEIAIPSYADYMRRLID